MINKITVIGIKSYAYHGCLREETAIGGEFITDVIVTTDFSESAKTDNLDLTIDYVAINAIVEEEMAIRADLIETVAYNIHQRVQAISNQIKGVFVEIKKINPPINGDVNYVSVIVEN